MAGNCPPAAWSHDVHRWVAEQLADIASRGAKLSRRAGTETGAGAVGDR